MDKILLRSFNLLIIFVLSGCVMKPTEEVVSSTDPNAYAAVEPYISRGTSNEYFTTGSIDFYMDFNEDVTNVDISDFIIESSGVTHGTGNLTQMGPGYYRIDLSVSGGDGYVRVTFNDLDNSVKTISGDSLSYTYHYGDEAYTIDNTQINVQNIYRDSPSTASTSADPVTFRVEFSEWVVLNSGFEPALAPSMGSITGSSCNGTICYITVSGLSSGSLSITPAASFNINDLAGNSFIAGFSGVNETYTITIDSTPPSVNQVSTVQTDGSYNSGDFIDLLVEFNEVVNVNTTGGTPQLTLNSGAVVDYLSGSGTNVLTFQYAVAGGENSADLDYLSTTALAFNGGSITDASGNTADLTLPVPNAVNSISDDKAIVIDTAPPSVASINRGGTPAGNPTTATSVQFDVTFTEAVSSVITSDFSLTNTGIGGTPFISNISGSGTNWTVTVDVTGKAGDIGLNFVDADNSIIDNAGNPVSPNTHTSGQVWNVDNILPTVNEVRIVEGNGTYGIGQTLNIEVEFSEVVNVTGTPQLTLETGATDAVVNYTTGSGSDTLVFPYTISINENSSDLDYVSTTALSGGTITDNFGNNATLTLAIPGSVNSISDNQAIVIDGVVPTITSITSSTPGDGNYSNPQVIDIIVTFSENIVTSTSSLTLDTGVNANYQSGSGGTSIVYGYTVVDGHNSSDLNVTSFNIGDAIDSASNAVDNSLPAGNNLADNQAIIIDTTEPTITSITSTTPGNGTYGAGQDIDIIVTFSENIVTSTSSLTLDTGVNADYQSGSGGASIVYRYTVGAGHSSPDLTVTAFNSGDAVDSTSNAVDNTLPGGQNLADNQAIVIQSNQIPVIDPINDETVDENVAITQIDANDGGDDFDADSDALTYSCVYDNLEDGSVAPGTACTSLPGTSSFNTTTGVFDWTPDFTAAGLYEIKISGNDGSLNDDEFFTITVNNVDQPPVLFSISGQGPIDEGTPITAIDANDATNGDADADGDPITFSCTYDFTNDFDVTGPALCDDLPGGNFDTGTGVFSWTPDQKSYDFSTSSGFYEFKIGAVSSGGTDEQIFQITINQIDLLPELVDPGQDFILVHDFYLGEDFYDIYSGIDEDRDGEPITYSCSWDSIDNDTDDPTRHSCDLNGFSFDTDTGILDGAPEVAGVYEFEIIPNDSTNSGIPRYFTLFVEDHSDFVEIFGSSTGDHFCGITSYGKTYCWGSNSFGQLGDSTSTDRSRPEPVDTINFVHPDERFIKLSLGAQHTCGITDMKNLYCWGDDGNGQLGDGASVSNSQVAVLVDLSNLSAGIGERFVEIAAGVSHTCGISNFGETYCWGADFAGQLGNGGGSTVDQFIPDPITTGNLGPNEKLKSVVAGERHTCGISDRGRTFCWGGNNYSQLGTGGGADEQAPREINSTNLNPSSEVFTALYSGTYHVCGITDHRRSFCWGQGGSGQLGDNNGSNQNRPVEISFSFSALYGTSFNSLSGAYDHTCGITNVGKLFCWGDGSMGQHGYGPSSLTFEPSQPTVLSTGGVFKQVVTSYQSSCGLTSNGNVYCWGSQNGGKLGNGQIFGNVDVPVSVDDFNDIPEKKLMDISIGAESSFGIRNDGNIYAWGSDFYGELGNGGVNSNEMVPKQSLLPFSVEEEGKFISVSTGQHHSCALTAKYEVYCWGRDNAGQLGNGGSNIDQSTPVPINKGVLFSPSDERFVLVKAGYEYSCGITSLGLAYCWGDDNFGKLGNGGSGPSQSPSLVDMFNLNMTPSEKFVDLALGFAHACGLTSYGKVYCWGRNDSGQLGNGNAPTGEDRPVAINHAAIASGTEKVVKLVAGDNHTCALTSGGKVFCWGDNSQAQLSNGTQAGFAAIPQQIINGSNLGTTLKPIDLYAGSEHNCILVSNGDTYCWGRGLDGQLGNGANGIVMEPELVVTSNFEKANEKFIKLSLGYNHSCGISSIGNTYCWGSNGSDKLGDNSSSNQNIPVMIDDSNI